MGQGSTTKKTRIYLEMNENLKPQHIKICGMQLINCLEGKISAYIRREEKS